MSAHNPPAFGQWQPIATAPKDDGTVIRVWDDDRVVEAIYVDFGDDVPTGSFNGVPYCNGWHFNDSGEYMRVQPRWWKPVVVEDAPPTEAQ